MTILVVMRDHKLRESAQAGEVYAAVVSHRWRTSSGVYDELRLRAVNGSSAPVFHMTVEILEWDWKRPRSKKASSQGKAVTSRMFPTLMPGTESKEIDLDGMIKIAPSTGDARSYQWVTPPVRFSFTDAGGRRWIRWPDGRLVRLHEKRPTTLASAGHGPEG